MLRKRSKVFKSPLQYTDEGMKRSTLGRFIFMAFHKLSEDEGAYRMLFNGIRMPQLEQVAFAVKRKKLIGFGIFQILQAIKLDE